MKKIVVGLIALFLELPFIFSAGNSYGNSEFFVSIGSSFGVMNGLINEYVIDSECYNNHVSQLDWEVKNVPVLDLCLDVSAKRRLLLKSDLKYGFKVKSGIMEDFDWLNPYYWPDSPEEEITNYSRHTNFLSGYYKFSQVCGYKFQLPLGFAITPFFNFETEKIAFDGQDGWREYKSENWRRKEFSGKVISYEQSRNSFFLGMAFSVAFDSWLHLNMTGEISPKTTDIDAIDMHFLTQTAFWDHVYDAMMYKGHADLLFSMGNFQLGCIGNVYYMPESTGYTSSAHISKAGDIDSDFGNSIGDGGSQRILYDVSLVVKFHF